MKVTAVLSPSVESKESNHPAEYMNGNAVKSRPFPLVEQLHRRGPATGVLFRAHAPLANQSPLSPALGMHWRKVICFLCPEALSAHQALSHEDASAQKVNLCPIQPCRGGGGVGGGRSTRILN